MSRNPAHGFAKKIETRRDAVPGRSARGVGQWDQIKGAALILDSEAASDDLIEFFEGQELGDREFANGDNELRSEKIDLVVHPGRTIPDFIRRGNAISTGRSFSRKTAADRSEVNFRANFFFGHRTELLEPAEQGAAGRPRERFPKHRLFHARRLADQHDFAENGSAGNWRRQHSRTTPALQQTGDMIVKGLLVAGWARHWD